MCSRANHVIPSTAQLIAAEVIVEKLAEECIPQYDCFAVNKTRHQELGCMWSGIPDEGDPCFAFHKGVKADCSGATEYDLETTHLQCFMMKDYEVCVHVLPCVFTCFRASVLEERRASRPSATCCCPLTDVQRISDAITLLLPFPRFTAPSASASVGGVRHTRYCPGICRRGAANLHHFCRPAG